MSSTSSSASSSASSSDDTVILLCDGNIQKTILRHGEGDGLFPLAGSHIFCHFDGYLEDGSQFDTSRKEGKHFDFYLGKQQVIKCWDEGVATMRKGEKASFVCSPAFGYGERGCAPNIPPNATLRFEIELFDFTREKKVIGEGVSKIKLFNGQGWRKPEEDVEVTVKYIGRVGDEDGPVFVDCRDKEIVLSLADVDVPVGLETAIMSMKKGEKAQFWIDSEEAYGNKAFTTALMTVPPNSTVCFEVELISFVIQTEQWELDLQQKIAEGKRRKDSGNKFYNSGQLTRAKRRYENCLKLFQNDKEVLTAEEKKEVHGLKVSSLNNIVVVLAKSKSWSTVVEKCEEVLALSKDNAKALFRRGQAHAYMNKVEEALTDLEKVRADASAEAAALYSQVDPLIKPLQTKMKKMLVKEKKAFAGIFNKLELVSDAEIAAEKKKREEEKKKKEGTLGEDEEFNDAMREKYANEQRQLDKEREMKAMMRALEKRQAAEDEETRAMAKRREQEMEGLSLEEKWKKHRQYLEEDKVDWDKVDEEAMKMREKEGYLKI